MGDPLTRSDVPVLVVGCQAQNLNLKSLDPTLELDGESRSSIAGSMWRASNLSCWNKRAWPGRCLT
jgi:hypothetical protein